MVKRFFFDRVQVHSAGVTVDQAVIFPLPVLSDAAETPSAIGHEALPWAELALDSLMVEGKKMVGQLGLNVTFFLLLGEGKRRIAGNGPEESAGGKTLQKMPARESFFPNLIIGHIFLRSFQFGHFPRSHQIGSLSLPPILWPFFWPKARRSWSLCKTLLPVVSGY